VTREIKALRRISARLARGQSVDWEAEERSAESPQERVMIRRLRTIAAVASFHRSAQQEPLEADLSLSISLAQSVAGISGNAADPNGGSDALDPKSGPRSRGPAEPSLARGSRWGQFEILEPVGHGAFGEVYRARDTRLDREVALKILARQSAEPDEEVVREARLLARVRHPNVVMVHGADRIEGRVGIWMEFLRGETLDHLLRTRGVLDAREAALIGIDLCRALSAVHAAGLVHQDVKPANVMRAEGGRVVLMDFGVGREAAGKAGARLQRFGTPLFTAPEALSGSRADARSDVYSAAVILFCLVTGSLHVQASNLSELLAQHRVGRVRHARDLRPDLPEAFARVLDQALAADPAQRFATPGELEHALLQFLGAAFQAGPRPQVRKSRRQKWALLGAIPVLLLALALAWELRRSSIPPDRAPPSPFGDSPSLTLVGEHAGAMFGEAASGVGDVDQDGFDDLLVGAPYDTVQGGGKVYLYRGSREGLDPHPAWTAAGRERQARLGWSIAGKTNLSFDGFADLVIGAPGSEKTTRPGGIGRVYVFPGSRNEPPAEPVQILSDGLAGTDFGFAVATGDVNHDGADDLLVGEPLYPSDSLRSGRALLYLSTNDVYPDRPSWVAVGPPGSQFGITVDMSGDLNNDGFHDAVVGAISVAFGPQMANAGAAYVYFGSATGLDSTAVVLPGKQIGASAGRGVLIAGDLDGDGFADLAVGSEFASIGEPGEGATEIYFGSSSGVTPYGSVVLDSNTMGANFGGHLGSLGDIDKDGCAQIFIGAVRFQSTVPREGAGYLFKGSSRRAFHRTWFHTGGKAGTWYGACGGSAGDVNGDGRADLFVGAPVWDSENGVNIGRLDLFLHRR
jgi:serine/threonine-protein kinase